MAGRIEDLVAGDPQYDLSKVGTVIPLSTWADTPLEISAREIVEERVDLGVKKLGLALGKTLVPGPFEENVLAQGAATRGPGGVRLLRLHRRIHASALKPAFAAAGAEPFDVQQIPNCRGQQTLLELSRACRRRMCRDQELVARGPSDARGGCSRSGNNRHGAHQPWFG